MSRPSPLRLAGVALSLPLTIPLLVIDARAEALCISHDREGRVVFTNSPADGVCKPVVLPEIPGGSSPSSADPGNGVKKSDRPIDRSVAVHSSRYGVSQNLVRAVIEAESGGNPIAVSSKGAKGIMQLMPATARRFQVSDPLDPDQNIEGGVKYLSYLLDLYGGDTTLAVAAYNAGEEAVRRHGGIPPYRETKDYVRKVLGMAGGNTGRARARRGSA